MAVKMAAFVRNAILDSIETSIGTSPVMKIFTGAPPTNPSDADSGTVLATINLPSDWMAAATSGVKVKAGIWQDNSADASGTAGHFRIYQTDGTTVAMQGTVTATGGGGDATINNASITSGQPVTVVTFTMTAPHA